MDTNKPSAAKPQPQERGSVTRSGLEKVRRSGSQSRAPKSRWCLVPSFRLKPNLARAVWLSALTWAALPGTGQVLPLELPQTSIHYNYQSVRGVPISSVTNDPPGSDGRAPSPASGFINTTNQFQSLMGFGGLVGSGSNASRLNPALNYAANAANLDLPRGNVGNGQVILLRARIGNPVLSLAVSFYFGEIITPPETDEYGIDLDVANTGVSPPRLPTVASAYWLPEPYSTTGHTDGGYYWSPHAERVYATESGAITVVWRKTVPSTNAVPILDVGTAVVAGSPYTIRTNRYVVSVLASKRPRRMYWTEGPFTQIGKVITIPTDRVQDVNVVYNSRFPKFTPLVTVGTNQVRWEYPFDGSQAGPIAITNTLWYDRTLNLIRAYNIEGRVFVELLGDKRGQAAGRDIHVQLGYELVDLIQRPIANDVTNHLGELVTPYQGDPPADTPELFPEPILTVGESFAFRHSMAGTPRFEYFAIRETKNQNDYQVHWMEEGLQGLLWPYRFVRYAMVWPDDVARYSHYVRPSVANEEEAKATAVPLPSQNAPAIAYQDPLDGPRGKLTENFAYYSFLTRDYPAHRALLRFTAGEHVRFERVFSWLDQSLRDQNGGIPSFTTSVATNLTNWVTDHFVWPDELVRPRIASSTVFVGDRIRAPTNEIGDASSTDYLAGFIRETEGNLYHPSAYVNPFVSGFDLASQGAIIPVNAIPGANRLEVWWFRKNQVEVTRGFKNSYWPSVIGRYTIEWPSRPSEIILASNDGTGPLTSLEAKGSIYYENDRSRPGYNPNEEHALMQGGQGFALRDDLNIIQGAGYTSHPFVLLEYTAEDGRKAIRSFRVRREDPDKGITFQFRRPAGTILQPPMPLPLLGVAFAPKIPGQPRQALNEEIVAWTVAQSDRIETNAPFWTLTTAPGEGPHGFRPYWPLALQDIAPGSTSRRWFFGTGVTDDTVTGVVSSNRPYALGPLSNGVIQTTNANRWRFGTGGAALPNSGTVLLAVPASELSWVVTVRAANSVSGYVEVDFGMARPGAGTTNTSAAVLVVPLPLAGVADNAFNQWRLGWNELPQIASNLDLQAFYASATVTDRKGNLWVYRGPHRDDRPEAFSARFYYNTLPGFFFPSRALDDQPEVGTATPYLRPIGEDGEPVGDEIYGNENLDQVSDNNALAITYIPVWPENAPVLQMAETLTTPRRGLPAVRGQSSVQVLYQQSQIETDGTNQVSINANQTSVVLHDPTREKTVEFDQAQLPSSIRTEMSRGKIFFPNLPPHLVKRFFLDPNRGANGALVFHGEFVDAPLGDSYVLLNVAGTNDATELLNLCLAEDPNRSVWNIAVTNLATVMEKFVENPARPGTYIPFAAAATTNGLRDIARVADEDVAVDSYALSAIGPGTGYVSLIVGNGEAFTPEGDPVSVHVLRVVPELYRGELKVIESENPLNERLTLQQVADLAGRPEDYTFQWRITAPVDGQPPDTYDKVAKLLYPAPPSAPWSHVRFVRDTDDAASIEGTASDRVAQDVSDTVASVSDIPFQRVTNENGLLRFILPGGFPSRVAVGDRLVLASREGTEVLVTVHDLQAGGFEIVVSIDPNQALSIPVPDIFRLSERVIPNRSQSIVFTRFVVPPEDNLTEVWLSLELAQGLGARVYLNGGVVATNGFGTDDTVPQSPPADLAAPRLSRYFRLPASVLAGANRGTDGSRTNRLTVELFSAAAAGTNHSFEVRVEAFRAVDRVTAQNTVWLELPEDQYEDGVRAILGGTADVQSLSDNYLTMRYVLTLAMGDTNRWSLWTEPQLAEGWIKRVLKGINPFNQRVTDLFNNAVNTDVSILTQAGKRWEGDIALNLESINNYGLIEIYETVLNRGRMLSLGGDINYGPANDALLLAAGYISDLYMMLGNEAAADAANPTIGIGTKDNTYGDIATALFSFRGQLPSLLEEELALLRGRDDFLVPGVETRPVYNRMVWNYTRGIDAGEVIYALNYNILDQDTDGRVDANDASRLFPQGHGDAYGHYLTALKGYYHLFLDRNFDWVPRSEAVLVLEKPVSVDYQDERKFAAAAGALARTGKQIFDLTWRRDYQSGTGNGWSHFSTNRSTAKRTRSWGMDHWAARTAEGAYFNWIVGNAIIPEVDPDPAHLDTIQQVDRTTVPELQELPAVVEALQVAMDNAASGLTPLGLPEDTIPFDLNPLSIANGVNTSHFEQIYQRAIESLKNATTAFDDAKDVTRLMRSEQDSLADFRTAVEQQELAYTNALIEIYGTPYPEDIGPGKTYRSGFAGPDTIHYMYIDNVELKWEGPQGSLLDPKADALWRIDTQTFTANWLNDGRGISDFNFIQPARNPPIDAADPLPEYLEGRTLYVEFNLASHGFFKRPATWVGKRVSPGRIQQAISDIVKARNAAYSAFYDADAAKYDLDWAIKSFDWKKESHDRIRDVQRGLLLADEIFQTAKSAWEITDKILETVSDALEKTTVNLLEIVPKSMIAGVASGGDLTAPIRGTIRTGAGVAGDIITGIRVAGFSIARALETANTLAKLETEFNVIAPEQWNQELREATSEIRDKVYGMQNHFMTVNERLQELDDAHRQLRALLAEGDRIQQEREIFRQRTAAVIQGYRTRDAAFRIFRNEKLERYKSLYDLAAQYSFMAAKAYDYDTGLLGTPRGREFLNRIVQARALGVIQDGVPQFAGSSTGDPGLSSALAEMNADWSVVKGRLGIKNPDAYGTTVSLRTENFRIHAGTNGDSIWRTVLSQTRKANLLDDPDVRRYCLQIDSGNGLPVPGFVLEFSTTIADGLNLFGRPLAPGDHAFSPSSFATKIFAMGVALEGYVGMDDPSANGSAIDTSGASSPADPDLTFLDPTAMSATPYIYLILVGVDSLRSPPLGDTSTVRTWSVDDVAIPLPFNIGGSGYSNTALWQSADSLSEPLFAIRKHQAFRPVSSSAVFGTLVVYWTGGELERSQYTNTRLLGRSAWNSRWKIVIPGKTLLNDPDEGIERFLNAVHDIKLFFHTYSYSGN